MHNNFHESCDRDYTVQVFMWVYVCVRRSSLDLSLFTFYRSHDISCHMIPVTRYQDT
jgi:hypothetical protein